jgi:hypothetical protein
MSKALNLNSVSFGNSEKAEKASAKNVNFFSRIMNNYLANKQAKRIIKALDEAEKIHAGRKPTKSFTQSIKEL